jgi:hypothetical protein
LGAEIPQMSRHDGNWRVRHFRGSELQQVDVSASG